MPKPDLEAVKATLRDVPWTPIRNNRWTTHNTVHEKVKSDLQYQGIKQQFQVYPEFCSEPNGDNGHKIDVGWFSREDYEPAVAFEIDGGVANHSVEKLGKLPDDVVKVIISKSPNQTHIYRKVDENLPENYEHLAAEVWR